MHAVGPRGLRERGATRNDRFEARMTRNFPLHGNQRFFNATVKRQELRCEARPEHHAIGCRITARNTEGKRISGPSARRRPSTRAGHQ